MISFKEFCSEQDGMTEGFVRSGTIATFAARSAAAGKKVEDAYKRGKAELESGGKQDDMSVLVNRIIKAVRASIECQMLLSRQVSNHVFLDTVGHTASHKKQTRQKK